MSTLKILVSLIAFTLFLTSCEKELDINFKDDEQKIVVNSLLNDQEAISIEISKSFQPGFGNLEGVQISEVENASVDLFENDILMETLSYSKMTGDVLGKYRSTVVPNPNHRYSIKVMNADEDVIEGQTSLPQLPSISNTLAEEFETSFGITKAFTFSFNLIDSSGEQYYYFYMDIPVMEILSSGDTVLLRHEPLQIGLDDDNNKQLYLKYGFVFSDENFDESDHTISGSADIHLGFLDFLRKDDGIEAFVDLSKIRLTIHSLSKETYLFYQSHSLYLTNQYEFYTEPINVFSNIENGLGIFGGAAVKEELILVR